MNRYIFDNTSDEKEFRRLQLVEMANDLTTITLLEETGMQPGWHCLELGTGAGSILRWLGHRVGPSGLAVGVDKNTGYLHDCTSQPFQVYQSTFLDVDLPHAFDLIHGRYVLIHNQSDMDILHKMFSLLKPGGWAVFEEPDFTSARLLDHGLESPQARVNGAICQMFVNAGFTPFTFRKNLNTPGSILPEHNPSCICAQENRQWPMLWVSRPWCCSRHIASPASAHQQTFNSMSDSPKTLLIG